MKLILLNLSFALFAATTWAEATPPTSCEGLAAYVQSLQLLQPAGCDPCVCGPGGGFKGDMGEWFQRNCPGRRPPFEAMGGACCSWFPDPSKSSGCFRSC